MDSFALLKPNTATIHHFLSNPITNHPSSLPLYSQSSRFCFKTSPSAAVKKQPEKIRCEFDSKINGSPPLSSDFDSRFLDKQKALEAAMNDINNSFGKGSVTRLGSAGGALVETFPSGCLTLDFALGIMTSYIINH